ncbi:endonuclease/exonuclease/phosphatase family protein [Mangrovicella endophytica]|uniref:endonuclease/exonuclease/phosphatase family protein n=1 Tax=Mangrovicella endophytica TaxID=2066697 RepID=UPI000C9E2E89|nr:endonuclease/exonuclease/phosphatase family protein [Mangrovicella endophytica]
MIAGVILAGITALFVAGTLLSFARIPHGFIRGLSFPRLQILAATVVLLPLTILYAEPRLLLYAALAGQALVIAVQAVSIAQYTPLRSRQSQGFDGDPDGPNTVQILSCNVKMSNRDYAKAIDMARRIDPDIAVFMETDKPWTDALRVLADRLPHVVAHPLDNAYGMILLSRLPLSDTLVRDLVMEDVPSIVTAVTLRNGRRFRFHAVHPEPPVPHIDSVGRDAELLKVAEEVEADTLPVIVSGDLNDVAWSHTSRLFQRVSRLLDPRIGRGFYNTFDARYWFIRWPLDHLFHDSRFQIVDMRRLPFMGSDHFPMYFKLALTGDAAEAEEPREASASDRAEVQDIEDEAEVLNREPVGVDWES